MARLLEVVEKEALLTTDDGLEAIIFTAQGDMRQVGRTRMVVERLGNRASNLKVASSIPGRVK